jgi:hypothetical protein
MIFIILSVIINLQVLALMFLHVGNVEPPWEK